MINFIDNVKLKDKSHYSSFVRELLESDDRIKACCCMTNNLDCERINLSGNLYIPHDNFILFSGLDGDVNHQIAHFIEMNNIHRLTVGDFGFGKFNDVMSKMFNSKGSYFIAAFMREMRVRCIQYHIEDKSIYRKCPKGTDGIRDRNTILNHIFFGDVIKFIPFGKFKDIKSFNDFILNQEERIFNSWSKDKIKFEFNKRLDYMRNWMETSIEEKLAALWIFRFLLLKI